MAGLALAHAALGRPRARGPALAARPRALAAARRPIPHGGPGVLAAHAAPAAAAAGARCGGSLGAIAGGAFARGGAGWREPALVAAVHNFPHAYNSVLPGRRQELAVAADLHRPHHACRTVRARRAAAGLQAGRACGRCQSALPAHSPLKSCSACPQRGPHIMGCGALKRSMMPAACTQCARAQRARCHAPHTCTSGLGHACSPSISGHASAARPAVVRGQPLGDQRPAGGAGHNNGMRHCATCMQALG